MYLAARWPPLVQRQEGKAMAGVTAADIYQTVKSYEGKFTPPAPTRSSDGSRPS